ncbi:MAG: SIS domain-containing protein [Halorhabdus sp.]
MTITDSEIREGCDAIDATFNDESTLSAIAERIAGARTYYLVGCGSSYWVGAMAAHWIREAGEDAHAVTAAEFYFGDYRVDSKTVVVAYSQSGETTETVRALEAVGEAGATTATITNTAGSTLAAIADHAYVTPAGTERSVLATKSVDAAATASYLLAMHLGDGRRERTWSAEKCQTVATADAAAAVDVYRDAKHTYALGTGIDHALAGEAARKLGEGPLVHATPMSAMEISHGPRANVDGDPVLLIASDPAMVDHYEPLIEELQDAGARVVTIQPASVSLPSDASIPVPHGDPQCLYVLKAIQRVTLALALDRDRDPDDPPSLTKHVEREDL